MINYFKYLKYKIKYLDSDYYKDNSNNSILKNNQLKILLTKIKNENKKILYKSIKENGLRVIF